MNEKFEKICQFFQDAVQTVHLCVISAVDLSNVLTPDALMPLLADPEFREQLAPFLPAGDELPQSPTELSNTLRSPQFQQVCPLSSFQVRGKSYVVCFSFALLITCSDWLN